MLLLSLLACGPEPVDGVDDTADTARSGAFVPDIPAAGCDAPEYSWLSTETMGEVIDTDLPDGLTLSAETLQLLLGGVMDTSTLPEIRYGVMTHSVRYRTQDRGQAVEATGLVIFPDVPDAETLPMVLWLHPTAGFSDACAPSGSGIVGAAFPVLFASMGFVVVAPDYLGMAGWGAPSQQPHPYVVAEPTAVASLDMLRAAVSLAESEGTLAKPDPDRVIYWGASQGGHAALWADRYAPHYVPEFTAVGSIAAVPASDLVALAALGVAESGPATLGIAANLTAASRWYDTGHALSEILAEGMDEALVALMDESCDDFSSLGELSEVTDLFTPEAISALSTGTADSLEPWSCYLEESSIHSTRIPHEADTPTLVILSEEDDLAIAAPVRTDIEVLCERGQRIEHLECAGAGHADGAVDTLGLQAQWALDRGAGVSWDAQICVINEPVDCVGEQR
jgi:pimeloyl-ACP methyl ester carboxylesterase